MRPKLRAGHFGQNRHDGGDPSPQIHIDGAELISTTHRAHAALPPEARGREQLADVAAFLLQPIEHGVHERGCRDVELHREGARPFIRDRTERLRVPVDEDHVSAHLAQSPRHGSAQP